MHTPTLFIFLLASLVPVTTNAAMVRAAANPIRKVVMMLRNMQKQVTEEGQKQAELYDKFMCYCQTAVGDLEKSIAVATANIGSLTTSQKEDLENKAMTDQSLKEHEASRAEAKEAMAEATALRRKEASAYAKLKSD